MMPEWSTMKFLRERLMDVVEIEAGLGVVLIFPDLGNGSSLHHKN